MHAIYETVLIYLESLTIEKFFSTYWYFIIFDFGRYFLLSLVMVIIYLLKYSERKTQKRKARKHLFYDNPLVSVIVPGKNEGKHIPKLTQTLRKQTYKNIETIIVDDGSKDDTAGICRNALKKGEISRFFSVAVRGGKASAANLALRYARGAYIIHIDADSNLDSRALEEMLIPFYMDKRVGAVGGDIRVANAEESLASSLQALEYAKTISIGRRVASQFGILRIISGAFGAFKTDILRELGGWDVGPGLDGDITVKIRKLGYRVVFAPDAVCFTNTPVSFKALARQRFRWSRSLIRFRLRKHIDMLFPYDNFRWPNCFFLLDNLLFGLILNINWFIYTIFIISRYGNRVVTILFVNLFLYTLLGGIQMLVILCLAPNKAIRRHDASLWIYIPAMSPYSGLYLRFVTIFAHLSEFFFKSSYRDPWNPWKVSRKVLQEEQ
ncbi:MAG: glycosyltransferase family 2 protein [Chitinispirillaceae bacterium]